MKGDPGRGGRRRRTFRVRPDDDSRVRTVQYVRRARSGHRGTRSAVRRQAHQTSRQGSTKKPTRYCVICTALYLLIT
eukprot:2476565-Prymnesium_polylepis.2